MSRTLRAGRGGLAAALAVVAVAGCGGSSASSSLNAGSSPSASASAAANGKFAYTGPPAQIPVPGSTVTLIDAQTTEWPPPAVVNSGANSAAYVLAAGLPYNEEMLKVHYHAHLDVIINGQKVTVPPYLGFVAKGKDVAGLAPLHTHDTSGVIHIENDQPATFLLGQLFVEWGVRLSSTCVAGYCAGNGKELAIYVDGKKHDGDPNTIVLTKHEEIAIEYGDTGSLPSPPSTYAFKGGL